MLVTLKKTVEVSFHLIDANGFHAKAKKERFTAAGSRCRQNLKYEYFTWSFGRLRQINCTKKRAAQAARLFFIIKSITTLICDVVVAIAIVVS